MLDDLKYKANLKDSAIDSQLDDFLVSVQNGLSQAQKTLECKYLYDEKGSELFDQICDLPEYYPTRTEVGILRSCAGEIADTIGENAEIVELGSGASLKTRLLLSAMNLPALYVPVDISKDYLLAVADILREDYPDLVVEPAVADFIAPFILPQKGPGRKRLLFFPGSTIGNLHRGEASEFLCSLRKMADADYFLIGVDLKKDKAVLEAAYDDAAGVTAAFNLNILRRINRELGATFDLAKFKHRAAYNEKRGRVEMHIDSVSPQRVRVGDHYFDFAAGESIHSENSYKYGEDEFENMTLSTGWQKQQLWTDPDKMFAVFLLKAA